MQLGPSQQDPWQATFRHYYVPSRVDPAFYLLPRKHPRATGPPADSRPVVVRNEKTKDMKEKQELGITDATAAALILKANECEHCAMDCSIYERSTRIDRTRET